MGFGGMFGGGGAGLGGGPVGGGGWYSPRGPYGAYPGCGCSSVLIVMAGILMVMAGLLRGCNF
jgi:hypothetical protein